MARPPAKVLRSHRFASRRRDVRRARQRRRRRVTLSFLLLVTLVAGGWTIARSSLFALEGIEVAGAEQLSREEIIRASGLRPGRNMLSLDLDAVEARVSRLPLVRSVGLSKPAPSRVRITVTERTPAFVLETIQGLYHLDADAVVLGPTPGIVHNLPSVRSLSHLVEAPGTRIRSVDVTGALSLWRALPAAFRKGAPVIEVRPAGITVIRPGLTIRFGTLDRIPEKMAALRLVVERAKAEKERLASIDLRAPARPAAVAA